MSLTSKIAAASKRVGGRLATDKTNKEQGYQYLSADAILGAGGQALAEEGVVIFPSVIDWAVNQFVTDKGKTRYDARVNYVFTVAADDEAKDFVWVGLGSDYVVPDKAYYKAVTSGHKYFVAKLLNVGAFNEDGELTTLAQAPPGPSWKPPQSAQSATARCGTTGKARKTRRRLTTNARTRLATAQSGKAQRLPPLHSQSLQSLRRPSPTVC